MNWYNSIKWFYDQKLWNKAQVWDAVQFDKITQEQYTEITSEVYPEERP
jgi:uncharacterized XkdX family phage protein